LQDVPDGECIAVELEDREIALYRVDARVYATDNLCTHGAARLCDGFLEGYAIECPLHQGSFDIRDGKVLREPAEEPLATYTVEVDEQGEIYIDLPAS
jgi:naphthalene 1,2-dioxygenase system ferredoxin subunit